MPRCHSKVLALILICMIVLGACAGARPAKAGEFADLGFEDGTLDGWVVVSSPDAVDVSGGDKYAEPYWGDYMAVLGTPAGGGSSQPIGQNIIAKTFTVLTPNMAFAYNVFTSDYPSFDRFGYVVTLLHQGTVIAQFSTTAFGEFPGGNVISTGWREVGLDLNLYQKQELTIQINAGGTSDTKFPTWAYFDMQPVQPASWADTMAPVIVLPGLDTVRGAQAVADSSNSQEYTLVTDVTDDSGWVTVGVLRNGAAVAGGSTQGWQSYGLSLSDGFNECVIVATDASGNATSRRLTVFVDSQPPDVSLEDVPRRTAGSSVLLRGTVVDARSGIASLTINGSEVPIGQDGSFEWRVPLAVGANSLAVQALDSRGNEVSWDLLTDRISAGSTGFIARGGSLTVGSTVGMLDGVSFPMDVAPMIQNGRTLLPVRALVEALGGKVIWNKATHAATIVLGDRSVVLEAGKAAALANGKAVPIDPADTRVVPVIIEGRTFLPLRFIAENLGMELTWEPVSRTISFTYWP